VQKKKKPPPGALYDGFGVVHVARFLDTAAALDLFRSQRNDFRDRVYGKMAKLQGA